MKSLLCAALISMLPGAAFAEGEGVVPTELPVAAEQATPPANLVPQQAAQQPQPAVQEATRCGMHGCCAGGRHHGGALILVGVAGTVLTAVAVGVAVGLAHNAQYNSTVR